MAAKTEIRVLANGGCRGCFKGQGSLRKITSASGEEMHRDVVDIRNGAETLTLSRFAALAESGRERGPSEGVDRALRQARSDPRAMAELRAFLSLHGLMPFGYVLNDDEVLRIAETAIVIGALEARLTVNEKQYQPTGPPQPPPRPPPSSSAPTLVRYQRRPLSVPADVPVAARDRAARAAAEKAAAEHAAEKAAAEKTQALGLENQEGGHSLARHGPEVPDAALDSRIKTGIAADNKFSPTGSSTRFKTYQDWLQTRQAARDAIASREGIDLRKPPPPGKEGPFEIVVDHGHAIDDGFVGRPGTKVNVASGGKTGKGFSQTDPVKGLSRTKTTIEWNPGTKQWDTKQHFPQTKNWDNTTGTYTAPP
jgi:hypothetical protein